MDQLAIGLAVANHALADEVWTCLRDMPVRVLAERYAADGFEEFAERAGRLRPDLLIVELAATDPERQQQLRAIEGMPGHPALVAVQATPEPDAIMAAMRSGASEYLYPPFGGRLRVAFERIQGERAGRAPKQTRGKTTGFLSAKGGCGATTIACHLAREFQRQTHHNLLLADLDVSAGIVRFLMKTKSPYSVVDAALNRDRLDKSYWKALVSNGTPRLEIIAAPDLGSVRVPDEEAFREVLRFTRAHYDWVLADLGRSLNQLSLGLLGEIDECYVVTTLDLPAMYQARQVIRTLAEGGYSRDRVRVLLNRVPRGASITHPEAESMLGVPVYGSMPEAHSELDEAYTSGTLAKPGGTFGVQCTQLAAKMAGVGQQPARPKRFLSLF